MRRRILKTGLMLLALSATPALAQQGAPLDPANTIHLDTKDGRIVFRLRTDLAPKHAEQIKALTKQGFYDGVVFHRVIPGFMAQTGDPTGTGTGKSSLPNIAAEFSNRAKFGRGTVGMARSGEPNSANSQFFIMFDAAPSLDGQYTIIGEVVSGMEVVDKIKKGDARSNGSVQGPDKIVRMRLASDSK